MKNTDSKSQAKLLILLGIVVVALQLALYFFLTQRIQQGEEQIYTDLHRLRVDVAELQTETQP